MTSVGVETGTGYLWRGLNPSIYVEGRQFARHYLGTCFLFLVHIDVLGEFPSSSGITNRADSGVTGASVDRYQQFLNIDG